MLRREKRGIKEILEGACIKKVDNIARIEIGGGIPTSVKVMDFDLDTYISLKELSNEFGD